MADIVLDEQSVPVTPASGQMVLYPDSASSIFTQKNDAGLVQGDSSRAASAQIASFSANQYITSSGIIIPSSSMQVGMNWEWKMPVTKTAGVAQPIFTFITGTNQSTADTTRLTITLGVQTAVPDTGFITCGLTCRSVGGAGVLQGYVWLQHNLQITGFATTPSGFSLVQGTSAGFDNTAMGGQYVSLAINPGTSAAWVIEQMYAHVDY